MSDDNVTPRKRPSFADYTPERRREIQRMGGGLAAVRDGKVLNPNFVDYRIPSSLDAPPIDVGFIETRDPYGPHGAKGLAETAINPTAAAIANAVCHATGVRVTSLPLTAEKVLAGLRKAAGAPGR